MNTKKDLSLLHPFNLEKAKSGEGICFFDCDEVMITYVGSNKEGTNFFKVESHDADVYQGKIDSIYLRMKPLCWLEGKPVYKGDKLWNTTEGLEDCNYIVDKYVDGQIVATEDSTGCNEYLYNLSWVKREVKPKVTEQNLPEVLNEPNKFKIGDKIKVVRNLPIGYYGDKGWGNCWTKMMNDYLGKEFTVKDVSQFHGYELDWHWFPSCVLELVETEEKPKETKVKVKVLEVYLDGQLIKREEIVID